MNRITLGLLGISVFVSLGHAQVTWRRAFGAFANDDCQVVRVVSDDLFILAGTTGSFGGGASDIYMLAVNGDGILQWSRPIGGQQIEQCTDMRIAEDGGMWLVGNTNAGTNGYEGLLIRTDATGEPLWQRTYGGQDWDFFHSVQTTSDGGVLISGQTFSYDDTGGKAWLLRMDSSGDTLWTHVFRSDEEQVAYAAIATQDGGYALCGATTTPDRELDAWVVKLNAERVIQWSGNYGGDSLDLAKDIIQTIDGGFSAIGSTRSQSAFVESYHLKVDATGGEEWSFNWGQISDQEGSELLQLPSGEYLHIGYTTTSGGGGRDMFIQKSGIVGEFVFGTTFGGFENDEGSSIALTSTGYVCGGVTSSYGAGGKDVFLVRTDLNGLTASQSVTAQFDAVEVPEIEQRNTVKVFPIPSEGWFIVEGISVPLQAKLLDMTGRCAEWIKGSLVGSRVEVSVPSGMYTLEWTENSGRVHRRSIIIARP